jgi:hypothetical protein
MKQFVKALNKEGDCFKYICQKCPGLAEAKLKESIFMGPNIRKFPSYATFESTINATENVAWQAFRDVVMKFHGNKKDPNYRSIVNKMLDAFRDLDCNMSLELS